MRVRGLSIECGSPLYSRLWGDGRKLGISSFGSIAAANRLIILIDLLAYSKNYADGISRSDQKTSFFFFSRNLYLSSRFCPSVFLYLSSVVPAIWLLELDKVERRLKMRESNINLTDTLNFTNLAGADIKNLEKALGVRKTLL